MYSLECQANREPLWYSTGEQWVGWVLWTETLQLLGQGVLGEAEQKHSCGISCTG